MSSPFINKMDNEVSHDVEFLNIKVNEEKDLGNITWLKKVSEINDGFCDEELNYFARISSLCVDSDGSLYVADSVHHKIFKFNNQGKYINSFGSQGQGPGEFLGTLRISIGNNGKLYVTDDGNWRFYIFSTNGNFDHQIPVRNILRDEVLVNSKGELYLLSQSGLKIIDCYDSNFKLKNTLIETDFHLNFPYKKPPKRMLRSVQRVSIFNVKKLLTRDDQLIVVSNNSQMVILFDKNHRIVQKFKVNHPRFIKDYKERLKKLISEGMWLNSFGSVFLDPEENLCFCYYNASLNLPEIIRYRRNGTFMDTIRTENLKERTGHLITACDKMGNFYSISSDSTKVRIYQIVK